MASARESAAFVNFGFDKFPRPARLGFGAALLAIFFGLGAFLILVLHDQGHERIMVHDQQALVASAPKPVLTPSLPASIATPLPPLSNMNRGRNDFSLTKSDKATALGSMRLKLLRTEMAKGLYDVNVIVAGRSYLHRRVKVTQPLWIAAARGSGSIELVVNDIGKDSISGYWKESDHAAQVSARSRVRHR